MSDWLPQTIILIMLGIGGVYTIQNDSETNIKDYLFGVVIILSLLLWGGFFT